MTVEKSHGKPRITMPRASRLAPGTESPPTANRSVRGRFGAGNQVATGRGWKKAVARMLGVEVVDAAGTTVAEDAAKTFAATMREVESDSPLVRSLAAQHARHVALAGFWSAKSLALGIGTDAGTEAEDRATSHGKEATRLVVALLDVRRALGAADRARPFQWTPASLATSPRLLPVATPTDAEMPEEETAGQTWFSAPAGADPGLSWFVTPLGPDVVEGDEPAREGPTPLHMDAETRPRGEHGQDTHDEAGRGSGAHTSEQSPTPKTSFRSDGLTRPIPREPLHPLAQAALDERIEVHRRRSENLRADQEGTPVQFRHGRAKASIGPQVAPPAPMTPELQARINAMQAACGPRQRSAPQWGRAIAPSGPTPEALAKLRAVGAPVDRWFPNTTATATETEKKR